MIVYKDRMIKITCPNPPLVHPVSLKQVEPTVIIDKYDIIWVALTPKHYENLSMNMAELLRFINDRSSIIKYYQECNREQRTNTQNENP